MAISILKHCTAKRRNAHKDAHITRTCAQKALSGFHMRRRLIFHSFPYTTMSLKLLNNVFCTWGVLECILRHGRSLINEVAYLRLGAMCLGDGRFFGRQGWMCWTRFVVPNVWLSQGFGKNRQEPQSILGAIYFTSSMIELIEYQNSIHSTCYVILSIV